MVQNINPHLITQAELNDLIQVLYLSKNQAKLDSRLQEWMHVEGDTKCCIFCNREENLSSFFFVNADV
jgi:hypothetical protein